MNDRPAAALGGRARSHYAKFSSVAYLAYAILEANSSIRQVLYEKVDAKLS